MDYVDFFKDEQDWTEGAARHGNLARVHAHFAIQCQSDTEQLGAYLHARWAARLGLAALHAREAVQ